MSVPTTALARVTGLEAHQTQNTATVIACIQRGLPVAALTCLQQEYRATQAEIGTLLSLSPSSLYRRKRSGTFTAVESEKIVRLARLKDAALVLMNGDEALATAWLRRPLPLLNNDSPMACASTEVGARSVQDVIGRIAHGVFS